MERKGGCTGPIEFKACSGGLIALDGVPVEAKAPRAMLEGKAVWPGERRQAAPGAITPGDAGYLALRRAKAKLADIQASLDRMTHRRGQPLAANHPVVMRGLCLLQQRRPSRRAR